MEEALQSAYRQAVSRYRRDDEVEVATENHRRLARLLEGISASFGRQISVLDAGCGTGRYFHCLKNVRRLVGIDVSPEMLEAARRPVRQQEISALEIELICGNVHLFSFPKESFDLIYSLGMFGYGCPVTVELCNKFYEWLAAGGKLVFNAMDVATLPLVKRGRHRLRGILSQLLPQSWQRALGLQADKLPFFGVTRRSLEAILSASRFELFSISRWRCRSPLWKGVHLQCAASKPA